MDRLELQHCVVEPSGSVTMYREADGSYTVEHKDLYRVYSRLDGLTRREAREEYKITAARC